MNTAIVRILTLVNLCQMFVQVHNMPEDKAADEFYVKRVDIPKDNALRCIMDDILSEDSINGCLSGDFYKMRIIDHKLATMVFISRLSRDFIQRSADGIGFFNHRGKFIMVNGDSEYAQSLKLTEDSLAVRQLNPKPRPDGIKSWTYKIEDGLCSRYFKGMGFMVLPDFKLPKDSMEQIHIVTLPIRNTNNMKR